MANNGELNWVVDSPAQPSPVQSIMCDIYCRFCSGCSPPLPTIHTSYARHPPFVPDFPAVITVLILSSFYPPNIYIYIYIYPIGWRLVRGKKVFLLSPLGRKRPRVTEIIRKLVSCPGTWSHPPLSELFLKIDIFCVTSGGYMIYFTVAKKFFLTIELFPVKSKSVYFL